MKTKAEVKFDLIIKEGFQAVLKPLGFKKKGNNFYLQLKELGQIINVQKSMFGSKDDIRFTINTGIFVPEYWNVLYNYQNQEPPVYPTEPLCLIRKRIGEIKGKSDTWYDITENTKENMLISEMKQNLHNHILPYFKTVETREACLDLLDREVQLLAPLGNIIVYGELKLMEKAKHAYEQLMEKESHPSFLENVKKFARKYGLE